MKNENPTTTYIAKLTQWRDELKLQAHLFSAEAKQEWAHLEKDWTLLESEIKKIAPDAIKAAAITAITAPPLFKKIDAALQRIREGVARHHSEKSRPA